MYNKEELIYTLYLIRSVLRDCIDKLDLPKNREVFLLYYGITSKQSNEIDKLFVEISHQKKEISFSEFNKMLNKRLDESFAPEVVRELLFAYKDLLPDAIAKIKS